MSVPKNSWVSYLPAKLQARIEHRPNLQKALVNSGWLLGDKILRMAMGFFVGVWIARYLGPQQFGLMNFAMAVTALFGAIAGLGLNGIVVRELVRKPEESAPILGTTFLLQFIGGLLAFVLSVVAVSVMRPTDELARVAVAILGLALAFKATDAVKYWFESQVKSKYTVWAETSAFLMMSGVRVLLILKHAPLISFIWAICAETVVASFFLLWVYLRKTGSVSKWIINKNRARDLLAESWPLILGAMASTINMRMDQVMLGTMVNDGVVGNYSAAVRLAEVWLIIPGIIGPSIYPAIISVKEKSEQAYRERILRVVKLMAKVVLPTALLISILSGHIVHLVYGQEYANAGNYLAIYIWTGVPYLIFFVLNQMFYIEGLLRIGFVVSIFSVASNLLLNLILIPIFGGTGAAISTLATAFGSTLLSLLILNSKTGIFFGKKSQTKCSSS